MQLINCGSKKEELGFFTKDGATGMRVLKEDGGQRQSGGGMMGMVADLHVRMVRESGGGLYPGLLACLAGGGG